MEGEMSHPLDERNALIVEAYNLGATREELARMAQITPQRVGAILKKFVPDYSFRRVYKTPEHRRIKSLENYHKKRGTYNKTREPRYDSIEADEKYWSKLGVQF